MTIARLALIWLVGLSATIPALAQEQTEAHEQVYTFDIPPQELGSALRAFAQIARQQVTFEDKAVSGKRSGALRGSFTPADALKQILAESGLVAQQGATGIFIVRERIRASDVDSTTMQHVANAQTAEETQRASSSPESRDSAADSNDLQKFDMKSIPEILVTGSKSLNMDIQRSPDGVQPYIVLGREQIERSGARNIDDFLRQKLTASSDTGSLGQQGASNTSFINLRGLGTAQTLILVDGHRIASQPANGSPNQPDLNGIPLSAVERIEVLPTTASGIYGGGATGGVVNVVLRRDYEGFETKLTYEDSFKGGGSTRRVDVAAGFNFEGGRTNLMLAGSYSDASELLNRDRDFIERARARVLANNPGAILNAATPPLGATTNICSASAYVPGFPQYGGTCDGQPLSLSGGLSLGSPITSIPGGYGGLDADGGAGLIANAGRYNLATANTVQLDGNQGALLNGATVESLMTTLRREFTPWLSGFLDLSASKNDGTFSTNLLTGSFLIPAGAPNNPFDHDILVTTPAFGTDSKSGQPNKNYRAMIGAVFKLPASWQAEADYTWNRSRLSSSDASYALTPGVYADLQSGALNVIRDTNAFPVDFSPYLLPPSGVSPTRATLKDASLRFGGPLGFSLPAGAPSLTVLLEHRKEGYDDYTTFDSPSDTQVISYARSQATDSIYAESQIPLVSAANHIPAVRLLELEIKARRDEYHLHTSNMAYAVPGVLDPDPRVSLEQTLTSTDPTVGLRYQPVEDLTIRASYGTGFLPPALFQLLPGVDSPTNGTQLGGLTDPRRGNELIGAFTLLTGGDPDLKPENSTSRSAGIVLTPRMTPGFRLSVDWTQIKKRDNVSLLFIDQSGIDSEPLVPGLITRGPASDGFDVGPILTYSLRYINVARQTVEALDIAADYHLETTSRGTFDIALAATDNLHNIDQVLETLPAIEHVGSLGQIPVIRWKANATVSWNFRNWSAAWTTTWFDSQCFNVACVPGSNTQSLGALGFPSQMYHDLFVAWRFSDSTSMSWLKRTDVSLSVRNVFDKSPPFSPGPPYYSTVGDPRLARYALSIRKSF